MQYQYRTVINNILIAIFIAVQIGCTNINTKPTNVNIEVDSPPQIRISNISVKKTDSLAIVNGILRKRINSQAAIPGHLDITFLSPDGHVLDEIETRYWRLRRNSRKSTFKVEVPLHLVANSTVRIEHHRTSIH